jgi:transcription-repair coupling factor (superfamily II helicase)
MEAVGYDMYLHLLSEAIQREKGEEVKEYGEECLVDLQVEAHIPESYIADLNQRLDIYRRIADIRTHEDSLDVTDELIDRFGDPPASVNGLVQIALLRNRASALGIREIKQQNEKLLFFRESFDMERVSALIAAMHGRVMLSAGTKPYISVKIPSGQKPLNVLEETLAVLSGKPAAEPNSKKDGQSSPKSV